VTAHFGSPIGPSTVTATVSAIIPCFKSGNFIAHALHSIGYQSYKDWDVVVVDDGGPEDGTRQVVERFGRDFLNNRVVYMRLSENRGVSAARNTAVGESSGAYVALLDPDDKWLPHHLQNAVSALDADPGASVCSSPAHFFRDNADECDGDIEFYDEWEREVFPCSLGIRNALPTSATVIRRIAFDEVGGFDEAAEIQHIEDYDMWLRIAALGRRFILLREPSACYRKHPLGVTSDSPRMQRLKQTLAAKHMPYLFALQKVALEDIAVQSRSLSKKVRHQEELIERQAIAIRTLQDSMARLMNSPPLRVLRFVRRLIRSGNH
jgi:glycosyltransferase involved in cell wall biosynthesis